MMNVADEGLEIWDEQISKPNPDHFPPDKEWMLFRAH